jgi:hypothetical protein
MAVMEAFLEYLGDRSTSEVQAPRIFTEHDIEQATNALIESELDLLPRLTQRLHTKPDATLDDLTEGEARDYFKMYDVIEALPIFSLQDRNLGEPGRLVQLVANRLWQLDQKSNA